MTYIIKSIAAKHNIKLIKKLNIRHLNGHLDFSSGFQVIDPSNYEKNAKVAQKP